MESSILNIKERIEKNRSTIMWSGIGLSLVGLGAIIFPFITTISITYFVASLFCITGGVTFFHSFSILGTGPFFGSLLMGLLKFACGMVIFFNPMIGMLYLTSLVAFLFMLEGAFEMTFAFELKPQRGWGWCLFSSVVSICSGGFIIVTLATSSLWIVGLIFGINVLSTGMSLVFLSRKLLK